MSIVEYYNQIKKSSLFVYLPTKYHNYILDHCSIEKFDQGTKIQPGDGLYIFLEGETNITVRGTEILVESMKPGRSIELDVFLDKGGYKHDWIAVKNSTFLVIEKEVLFRLFKHLPNTKKYLQNISSLPNLHRLKRDLKLTGADKKIINKLFLDFPKITSLDAISKSYLSIIVVNKGHVRATLVDNDKNHELLTFYESDYFFLQAKNETVLHASDDFEALVIYCDKATTRLLASSIPILDRLKTEYNRVKNEQISIKEIEDEDVIEEDEDDEFSVSDFRPSQNKLNENHKKKFIWMRQHDMMDCGAACLSMISRFYGKKINLATWRSLVHITREGASMLSLKKAAERVGFDSIGVMTGYKALQKLQVPCIALLEYHFVVVYQVNDNSVWVADPASQLREIPKEEFLKEFSNNCLLLKPNKKLKTFPESQNSFRKYFLLFKDSRLRVAEIMAISLVILIFGLAQPLFLQFVFDNVLVTLDKNYLRFIAIVFLIILSVTCFAEKIRGNLIASLTSKLSAKFNSLFVLQALKLPLGYFEVRNVGDITTRIEELNKIRDFFSTKFVITFINIISLFLYAGILALYDYRLLLVLLPFVPILLFILHKLMKVAIENLNETFQAAGKNQSMVFEHISGIRTLKNISGILAARWKWEETLVRLLQKQKEFEKISAILSASSSFFQEFIRYSLFIAGVYLYINNELSLGQVVAVHALGGSIIGPLIALLQEWDEFNKIAVSMEKVDEIFTSKTEQLDFSKPQEQLNAIQNVDVSFNKVFFQYGSEYSPMVLKGVDLTIPKGKMVAFVGASGSGKTTLAYMINQLYSPKKGAVLLGGKDIQGIPLEDLRESIALINQDNQLFSGTILDNITLGDPKPDYKNAVKAATLSHAHDFILQKKGGYYFQIGESGSGLSGGQKQRINIARSLYRNPNILIMDEATSALDAKSEEIILKNIKSRRNRTTIIIAHRLNTITHADTIFTFHNGMLVESGTHKELLTQQGRYFHMFKKQMELS